MVAHPTDTPPGLWTTPDRAPSEPCQRLANGASVGTISRPSGSSESGTILKLAMPKGMPMIVTHSAMPVTMWPRASHQREDEHRTLPMQDPAPASWRSTVV